MRVRIVVVGFVAALAACQTAYRGNEASPYYVVPAGSRLMLNQELDFAPGQVSVYVQNGRILRFSDVQKYDPFCKFELFHRVEARRMIAPDEILVTRAFKDHRSDTVSQIGRPYYARLPMRHLSQSNGDQQGGGSPESYLVRMDLRSEKQPDIFRMTCIRWSFYPRYQYPSIAEIRATMDPVFTLRTPGEG